MGWLGNKASPFPQATWQLARNADFRGDPIWTGDTYFDQTISALRFVGKEVTPIAAQNVMSAHKDTNITPVESILGARPAGMQYTNPEGLEGINRTKDLAARAMKAAHEGDFIGA